MFSLMHVEGLSLEILVCLLACLIQGIGNAQGIHLWVHHAGTPSILVCLISIHS